MKDCVVAKMAAVIVAIGAMVVCLMLVACGNSSARFIGDWRLAAVESQGITMIGNVNVGTYGTDFNMSLAMGKGGAGSVTVNDKSAGITWKQVGEDSVLMTLQEELEGSSELTATFDGDALSIPMEYGGDAYTIMLSKDGKLAGLEPISLDGAKDVADASEIAGTWRLTGVGFEGLSIFGDFEAFNETLGGEFGPTVTISADGTIVAFGETLTWNTGPNGASIEIGGAEIPMKIVGEKLVIDASSMMGGKFMASYSR